MVFHERFSMQQMKIICYVAGAVFIAVDVVSLGATNACLVRGVTRRRHITLAVRTLIAMPLIPFYFGVAFEERQLLFPTIIGCVYGIFNDILLGLAVVYITYARNQYDQTLFTIHAISTFASIVLIILTVMLIRKLNDQYRDFEISKQNLGQYALKRFDALPLTAEIEHFILGTDDEPVLEDEAQRRQSKAPEPEPKPLVF